jgi:GNAT superfamily N-acetyltransferase
MITRRCTIAELAAAPNISDVLDEYERECGMPELGQRCQSFAAYEHLEASGVIHPIACFDGPELLGFVIPVVVPVPHYGVPVATLESFFVPFAARARGVGLRLLNFAQKTAKELGAKALFVSAPAGGPLSWVLARLRGYKHRNDVFVRTL